MKLEKIINIFKNTDNIIMVVVHITGSVNQKVLLYKQLFCSGK